MYIDVLTLQQIEQSDHPFLIRVESRFEFINLVVILPALLMNVAQMVKEQFLPLH